MDLEGPGAETKASETLTTSTLMKTAQFGIPIAIVTALVAMFVKNYQKDEETDEGTTD